MFFLSLCTPARNYDQIFSWTEFIEFVSAAAFLAIPMVVFLFLWKNFATNAPAPRPAYSAWIVALYLLTTLVTFSLGVLVFETVQSFS